MAIVPEPLVVPTAAAPATRSRPVRKRLAQWLRRGHLYVGLFMIPWVLVYAVTGFLLNHHTVWPDGRVVPVTAGHVGGTGLDALPSAADLAADVTAALNRRAGGPTYRLADPAAAVFEWDVFPIEATADGVKVRVNLDPATRTGHAVLTPTAGPAPAPFAAPAGVFGDHKLDDRLKAGGPALLADLGVKADAVDVPWLPELTFAVADGHGGTWKVRYDPKSGAVAGRSAADPDPQAGVKQFLYRLHFTHGYPEAAGVRLAWAVCVDLTAAALVFWCLTGLVMWWQIKAVRRAGAVVLCASVLTAVVLGAAMHGRYMP